MLGTSTAATAATGLMPVGTPVPTGPHKTTTAEYDCDLSPYGYQSGTDQITMDVSTTAFESAVQGTTRT
ncbi:MAG TPA: hypothetical protein VK817_10645 [Trebonia sp.]|nr:hypothetical protein [Trebonia sp.]